MKLIYIISVLLVLGLVHLIFSMRMEKVKYDLSRENVNKKKLTDDELAIGTGKGWTIK